MAQLVFQVHAAEDFVCLYIIQPVSFVRQIYLVSDPIMWISLYIRIYYMLAVAGNGKNVG